VFLLGAMAIGALIGAVAGTAVYGVKTALSKEKKWSWKAAAAHAAGGFVGGGLFPAVFAGLAAAGLPVAGAYILAGGVAWGGLWTLAQDAASWGLGLEKGLGGPGKYLVSTGVGILATALLFPIAGKVIGSSGLTNGATVRSLVTPAARHVPASLVKSEAEFLAFGAMVEVADRGLNRAGTEFAHALADHSEAEAAKERARAARAVWKARDARRAREARALERAAGAAARAARTAWKTRQASRGRAARAVQGAAKAGAEAAPTEQRAVEAQTSPVRSARYAPGESERLGPFGRFVARTQGEPAPVVIPQRVGLQQQLEAIGQQQTGHAQPR
jgi:hypothetical protein